MAVGGYDGMHLIYEGLKKTNGAGGEALVNAMKGLSWTSPRGPVSIDPQTRDIVQNIYVRKVERVNGRLQNTVIHTFPNVSQFWTYKPEEFLRQPVYDRNNPPCRHCP
jgi:branched-chain amino acid transport system substrate-binding protein